MITREKRFELELKWASMTAYNELPRKYIDNIFNFFNYFDGEILNMSVSSFDVIGLHRNMRCDMILSKSDIIELGFSFNLYSPWLIPSRVKFSIFKNGEWGMGNKEKIENVMYIAETLDCYIRNGYSYIEGNVDGSDKVIKIVNVLTKLKI